MPIQRIFQHSQGLRAKINRMTGVSPTRLSIYKEALRHSSVNESTGKAKGHIDNERLEFLGDAILDAVVAEMLFLRYPYKEEGFLTEMRTRIVNRAQLSYLADRLGVVQIMEIKSDLRQNAGAMKTIGSNALEALIGAVYLDKGFRTAKKFIVDRLVGQYLDLDKMMSTPISYKAKLLIWSQQNQKKLEFIHSIADRTKRGNLYQVTVKVDEKEIVSDTNSSKKMAEELASEKACRELSL